ncbi:MAG TPA: hypothetical protein VLG10_02820 [Methylomirabilota bacterium]|nr:hypothetical protein [Methylomirabilota bacterium]
MPRAASPATLAALAAAPRIIAVHYLEVGPEGQHRDAFLISGTPVARIKARFLDRLPAQLALSGVRDVAEPRFPYRELAAVELEPSAARLQRTYRSGYVFDFYAPWRYVPNEGRLTGKITVYARLVRLEDLAVLWARQCSFAAEPLRGPPVAGRRAEEIYTAAALERADRCAEDLVTHFLGGARP